MANSTRASAVVRGRCAATIFAGAWIADVDRSRARVAPRDAATDPGVRELFLCFSARRSDSLLMDDPACGGRSGRAASTVPRAREKRVFFSQEELALRIGSPRTRSASPSSWPASRSAGTNAALMRPLSAGALAVPPRPEARPVAGLLDCSEHLPRWPGAPPRSIRVRALVEPAFPDAVGTLAVIRRGSGPARGRRHRSRRRRARMRSTRSAAAARGRRSLARRNRRPAQMPLAPHECEQAVVEHELRFAAGAGDRFPAALRRRASPPFAPATVDVVLTAWFIRRRDRDLRVTAAAINVCCARGPLDQTLVPCASAASSHSNTPSRRSTTSSARRPSRWARARRHESAVFRFPRSAARAPRDRFFFVAKKTGEAPGLVRRGAGRAVDRRSEAADPNVARAGGPREMSVSRVMLNLVDGTRTMADVADALAGCVADGSGRDSSISSARFFAKLPSERAARRSRRTRLARARARVRVASRRPSRRPASPRSSSVGRERARHPCI